MLYKYGLLSTSRTSCAFICLAMEVSWCRAGGTNCLVSWLQATLCNTDYKQASSFLEECMNQINKDNKNPRVPYAASSIGLFFPPMYLTMRQPSVPKGQCSRWIPLVESSQFEDQYIYLQLPKEHQGRGPLLGSVTKPIRVML